MMSNLFSIFDTSTNSFIELNWLSSILNLLMMSYSFWFLKSFIFHMLMNLYYNLYKELKIILLNKYNLFNSIYLISLFFMIMLNNLLGLFPYIFTNSSHMIFSISLSLPLWISLMLSGWFKNHNYMFAHMIPSGTPIILMPFMVMIETISNIIRPMTLTIRLTANMIAGHLLLTLLSQSASSPLIYISISIILIQIILLILEFSVSIIQSYVFMILSTLYLKETN